MRRARVRSLSKEALPPDTARILRCLKGKWSLQLDDYETDFPQFADDGETAVWTCASDEELLIVRGIR